MQSTGISLTVKKALGTRLRAYDRGNAGADPGRLPPVNVITLRATLRRLPADGLGQRLSRRAGISTPSPLAHRVFPSVFSKKLPKSNISKYIILYEKV